MPHKRNPIGSALARAGALRARADVGTLLTTPAQELDRAAGAWHAEWGLLPDALAHTGGAVSAIGGVLAGLQVDAARMRTNLAASGGVAMAERAQALLQDAIGREASLELPTSLGGGEITLRLHANEHDKACGLNRTENVRPIPQSDPEFARLYARRNDAESINRALNDTLYLGRAHSVGRRRQLVEVLGYALTVNSLALHRHRRERAQEAA